MVQRTVAHRPRPSYPKEETQTRTQPLRRRSFLKPAGAARAAGGHGPGYDEREVRTRGGWWRHWRKCTPSRKLRVPFAFKGMMIRLCLQFARRIAFRCVLHRCSCQDIHRRELCDFHTTSRGRVCTPCVSLKRARQQQHAAEGVGRLSALLSKHTRRTRRVCRSRVRAPDARARLRQP